VSFKRRKPVPRARPERSGQVFAAAVAPRMLVSTACSKASRSLWTRFSPQRCPRYLTGAFRASRIALTVHQLIPQGAQVVASRGREFQARVQPRLHFSGPSRINLVGARQVSPSALARLQCVGVSRRQRRNVGVCRRLCGNPPWSRWMLIAPPIPCAIRAAYGLRRASPGPRSRPPPQLEGVSAHVNLKAGSKSASIGSVEVTGVSSSDRQSSVCLRSSRRNCGSQLNIVFVDQKCRL